MAQKTILVITYVFIGICFLVAILYHDWTAIAAIAAIGAVFVAIEQAGLSRMSMVADLMMRLEDRFQNEDFLNTRKDAALAILKLTTENKGNIEDVLDFFETLGLLVHRKALDEEFAWSSFFYWLHGYYRWAEPFIKEQQKTFPNRYRELIWLHGKLLAIEKSKGQMNESEWDDFLEQESDFVTVFKPAKIFGTPQEL